MAEMNFQTERPHCEFFLAGENVGFLMLSASGDIYRKWQGLTVAETSILADIEWSFSHCDEENFSHSEQERTWLSAARTNDSVTRIWRLSCGCSVTQEWSWPASSQIMEINHRWHAVPQCQRKDSRLRLIPLWTLCPAGSPHAGGAMVQIIDSSERPDVLTVRSQNISNKIELSALQVRQQPVGRWQPLSEPSQTEFSTPHDAVRGENHWRSVIKTYYCDVTLKPEQTASVCIRFADWPALNESVSETNKKKQTHPSADFITTEEHQEWMRAFANSQVSLNQLVRQRSDGTLGLQAGLPWFTQFWTRDLCHSFRAAFLWSGRFADGEKLICDLWTRSSTTIPNYTTSTATTNNSADALPLLLLTTADLADVIGITAGLNERLNIITAHLRAGAQVFLKGELFRHGPADTWMDAQKSSPSGKLIACSPRADRAFEIQTFWLAALARWSGLLLSVTGSDDAELLASAVQRGIKTIRQAFYCKEKSSWADHLRSDDTQELSLRPNLFLGFSALHRAGILSKLISEQEIKVLLNDAIDSDLIVSYGVRTLSPDTSIRHPLPINDIFAEESSYIHENKIHFHPYHEFGSRSGLEHPDWAYHNGTIWPWLSHSASQFLLGSEHAALAMQLMETLIWHSNHGTQGGALTELLDGLSNHSHWSWPKGAPHQAWSEAALIHVFCEELLGIRIENMSRRIRLCTRHWQTFPQFNFSFDTRHSRIIISKQGNDCAVAVCELHASLPPTEIYISHHHGGEASEQTHTLSEGTPVRFKITHS
ncbi:MAG: hypothetical protein RL189_609 [Pseudomonadota bacterium]|jgi:glycogen debranching enzyme